MINNTEKKIIPEFKDPNILKEIQKFNKENGAKYPNSDEFNWWWNFEYFRFNEDGSFTCKASEEALNTAETQNLTIAMLWENDLNCQLAGEDGCAGNYDMYTPIYFPAIGFAYLILHSVSDQFARGKEVTIYGYEPDEEEFNSFVEFWKNY